MLQPELNRNPDFNPDAPPSIAPELLKGLQGFLNVVEGKTSSDAIFDIAEALANREVSAASIAHLKSHPAIAQLCEERYLAPTPSLDALLTLPEDSLGFIYAAHMKAAKLDPEFYREVDIQDDKSYITLRMRQTHDIWHVIGGFGVDPAGEIGLQAFQLAQNRTPLSAILLAAFMLNVIQMNWNLDSLMQVIQQGYGLGQQAKPLLAQRWEEAWEKPLTLWRSELNLITFPEP